jgi:hypothetical protein
MNPKMINRIAYTLFFALCALAAQATEHRVVDGLPKQMVGSWCRETDNDDRDFFTRFGPPAAWRARQLGFLRETQDLRGGRQLQVQLAAMDREADGARDVLQEALGEGPRRALCACCR